MQKTNPFFPQVLLNAMFYHGLAILKLGKCKAEKPRTHAHAIARTDMAFPAILSISLGHMSQCTCMLQCKGLVFCVLFWLRVRIGHRGDVNLVDRERLGK